MVEESMKKAINISREPPVKPLANGLKSLTKSNRNGKIIFGFLCMRMEKKTCLKKLDGYGETKRLRLMSM